MPESMSIERRKMMYAFGANIVLTLTKEDMDGAVRKYKKIVKENLDAWLPKQFENHDNPKAHEKGLGKEIIEQTGGKIDVFVAGIGTGGTLIGVARALKKINPNVKIIGVESAESAILSGGKQGLHKIQGIGEEFIPKLVKENMDLIEEVIAIKGEDAIAMSKELAKKTRTVGGDKFGGKYFGGKEIERKI